MDSLAAGVAEAEAAGSLVGTGFIGEADGRTGRISLADQRACSSSRSVDKALGGLTGGSKDRRGGLVANVALARKIAELFWRLMVHGRAHAEQGLKKYIAKVAQTEQRLLQKLAREYNLAFQPKAV